MLVSDLRKHGSVDFDRLCNILAAQTISSVGRSLPTLFLACKSGILHELYPGHAGLIRGAVGLVFEVLCVGILDTWGWCSEDWAVGIAKYHLVEFAVPLVGQTGAGDVGAEVMDLRRGVGQGARLRVLCPSQQSRVSRRRLGRLELGVFAHVRGLDIQVYHDHVWLSPPLVTTNQWLRSQLCAMMHRIYAIEDALLSNFHILLLHLLRCLLPSNFVNKLQVQLAQIPRSKHVSIGAILKTMITRQLRRHFHRKYLIAYYLGC